MASHRTFPPVGPSWTNQSIYNATGGNYSELAQYLKARRAQAQGAEGVAVAVAEAARLASLRTPLARASAGRVAWGGRTQSVEKAV